MSAPIAVVVNVEVKEDRVEEFLQVMEFDAVESRKEEGCLRFDVLRDLVDSNKFVFYEVYRDQAAIDFHKSTPHFQKWSEFNESGGVASFSVVLASGLYYTN
jgi:quinol monooxygenase YgiN|eukprot:gene1914-1386_t